MACIDNQRVCDVLSNESLREMLFDKLRAEAKSTDSCRVHRSEDIQKMMELAAGVAEGPRACKEMVEFADTSGIAVPGRVLRKHFEEVFIDCECDNFHWRGPVEFIQRADHHLRCKPDECTWYHYRGEADNLLKAKTYALEELRIPEEHVKLQMGLLSIKFY